MYSFPADANFFTQFAAFLLLFFAIGLALSRKDSRTGMAIGLLSLLAAALSGLVASAGFACIIPAIALAAGVRLRPGPWQRRTCIALLAIWALAAGFHALPGFAPLEWSESFGRNGDQVLRWHYDKGLAGLALLYALDLSVAIPEWHRRLLCLPLGAGLILLLAQISGVASFAPGWPMNAATWLAGNFFLTVVAEEAFFRGLLQAQLQDAFRNSFWPALLIASMLFALVHLGWGTSFALVALAGGLFYGLMFGRGRSLVWAVFAHWTVNAAALLLMHSPLG